MSKFGVEITDQQRSFLDKLPYGTRRILIGAILDDLIETCECSRDPNMVVAGVISRQIGLQHYSRVEGDHHETK